MQHTLLQICQDWRCCAEGYPALWSNISISLDCSDEFVATKFRFQRALRLSSNTSLRMGLWISYVAPGEVAVAELRALLRDIVASADRWVAFDGHLDSLPPSLLLPLRRPFPKLRELRFSYFYTPDRDSVQDAEEFESTAHLFAQATSLEIAILVSPRVIPNIDWARLKRFTATGDLRHSARLLEGIRRAARLEYFAMGPHEHDLKDWSGQPIFLNSVHTLVVTSPCLRVLQAPHATSLELDCHAWDRIGPLDDTDTHILRDFLVRSGCALTSLHLRLRFGPNVTEILEIPNLSDLEALHISPWGHWIPASRTLEDPCIMPRLQKLEMTVQLASSADTDTLRTLVRFLRIALARKPLRVLRVLLSVIHFDNWQVTDEWRDLVGLEDSRLYITLGGHSCSRSWPVSLA